MKNDGKFLKWYFSGEDISLLSVGIPILILLGIIIGMIIFVAGGYNQCISRLIIVLVIFILIYVLLSTICYLIWEKTKAVK